jgi:hypothetical protein
MYFKNDVKTMQCIGPSASPSNQVQFQIWLKLAKPALHVELCGFDQIAVGLT